MDTVHSSDPMHRELELLLPWYVKGRLDAAEAQRVQAHLASCPTCRAEAEGLETLFTAHEQTMTDRPVDEAQLADVFGRIDAYEAQRTKRANGRSEPMLSSVWASLGAALFGLLSARPAWVARRLSMAC
jgi:anti-sigma factor RsiW